MFGNAVRIWEQVESWQTCSLRLDKSGMFTRILPQCTSEAGLITLMCLILQIQTPGDFASTVHALETQTSFTAIVFHNRYSPSRMVCLHEKYSPKIRQYIFRQIWKRSNFSGARVLVFVFNISLSIYGAWFDLGVREMFEITCPKNIFLSQQVRHVTFKSMQMDR